MALRHISQLEPLKISQYVHPWLENSRPASKCAIRRKPLPLTPRFWIPGPTVWAYNDDELVQQWGFLSGPGESFVFAYHPDGRLVNETGVHYGS